MITRRTFVKGTMVVPALFALSACGGSDEEDEAAQDVATRVDAAGAPTFEAATEGSPAADEASPAAGEAPADGEATPTGGAPPPAGGAPITLVGYDIGWRYEGLDTAAAEITLTVSPGAVITLPNEGGIAHNFAVDALEVDVDMPVGQTVEATIPASAAPGEYEFYCNVPGHQALMKGTLVVQ